MRIRKLLRGIDGLSLAAARALVLRGPEHARRVIEGTLRGVTEPALGRHISARNLARSFAVDENVVVPAGSWFDGSLSPLERYSIAHLVRFFRPRSVVEIGTFRGTTTRLLLENLPEGSRIFTIDLPIDAAYAEVLHGSDERLVRTRRVGRDFGEHARASDVVQVLGNSADPTTWDEVPGGVDFAFIDASHTYEAVKVDTERLEPHLAEDAVVVWHDYSEGETTERGVGRFIRERMAERDNVFVVDDTTLALEVPRRAMLEGRRRVHQFFPDGDFEARVPGGLYPWLKV